jgi:1-acyl-sn-glycerol-3-phosphate acyltransferase
VSPARAGVRLARTAKRAAGVAIRAQSLGSVMRTRSHAEAFQAMAASVLDALDVDVVVSGRVPTEPGLLVANHLGYLDPLLALRAVPAIPLAKREVSRWPLIGDCARALGAIFIERERVMGRARALLAATRVLASGLSVLNFPEGTTTRGDVVLPFMRGLFGVAQALDRPIVPIRIDFEDPEHAWVGEDTFVPHLLRFAAHRRPRAYVRFGAPLLTVVGETPRALADRARGVIESMAHRTLPARAASIPAVPVIPARAY